MIHKLFHKPNSKKKGKKAIGNRKIEPDDF